jgi:hypothetical protein
MLDWLVLHVVEVWIVLGLVVYPICLAIAAEVRRSRARSLARGNANKDGGQ